MSVMAYHVIGISFVQQLDQANKRKTLKPALRILFEGYTGADFTDKGLVTQKTHVCHDIDINMKTMCFSHHGFGYGFLIYEYSSAMMT